MNLKEMALKEMAKSLSEEKKDKYSKMILDAAKMNKSNLKITIDKDEYDKIYHWLGGEGININIEGIQAKIDGNDLLVVELSWI